MKVAIVHDFLQKRGGAERVVKVFSEMFPNAPIYTLLFDEKKMRGMFEKDRIRTSYLQKWPRPIRLSQKLFLRGLPKAIEDLNFNGYDLVISSSGAYAHGVLTNTETFHLCYCHSPMRYAWDYHSTYLDELGAKGIMKNIVESYTKPVRLWDQFAGKRPDKYIANSKVVRNRIEKYYRSDAEVIYPPVNLDRFEVNDTHEDYFLVVSTLTRYKRIDLVIKLFNKIGRRLVIIGDGSYKNQLKKIANSNIEFLGFKPDEVVTEYMKHCRAFIFPGEDDFGITPIEAMACGKPVLAFGKGGALETIVKGKNGNLFKRQTLENIENALAELLAMEPDFDAKEIAKMTKKYSEKRFKKEFQKVVDSCLR